MFHLTSEEAILHLNADNQAYSFYKLYALALLLLDLFHVNFLPHASVNSNLG